MAITFLEPLDLWVYQKPLGSKVLILPESGWIEFKLGDAVTTANELRHGTGNILKHIGVET